jgi:hypothetical protein
MSKAEENLDTTPAHSQAGGLRPEHFQQRTFVMIIFDGFEYPVLAGWSLLSQRCDVIDLLYLMRGIGREAYRAMHPIAFYTWTHCRFLFWVHARQCRCADQ